MKIEYRYENVDDPDKERRYVFKTVFRIGGGHIRLFRLSASRPKRKPGDGALYKQISVGLAPKLYNWSEEAERRVLCLLGLRLRFSEVHGGQLAD